MLCVINNPENLYSSRMTNSKKENYISRSLVIIPLNINHKLINVFNMQSTWYISVCYCVSLLMYNFEISSKFLEIKDVRVQCQTIELLSLILEIEEKTKRCYHKKIRILFSRIEGIIWSSTALQLEICMEWY